MKPNSRFLNPLLTLLIALLATVLVLTSCASEKHVVVTPIPPAPQK